MEIRAVEFRVTGLAKLDVYSSSFSSASYRPAFSLFIPPFNKNSSCFMSKKKKRITHLAVMIKTIGLESETPLIDH